MERIRILMAGLTPAPRQAFKEAFKQVVMDQPDMEIVDDVDNGLKLLLVVGRVRADIVVLGLQDGTLPGISTHLLAEYPHLKILGVAADGRRAFLNELHPRVVSLEDSSPQGLLRAIRTAVVGDETDHGT